MESFATLSLIEKEIQSHPSVVLFLSTASCSVCLSVHERLTQWESRHPDTFFLGGKLDQTPELSGRFLVFTVPTVLVFQEGKELHRQSRFIRWDVLEAAIQESTQEKKPYE